MISQIILRQAIKESMKPVNIIHENSIIVHEVNISSMKTRKSLTLVTSKCDEIVTACATLKKDNLKTQKEFNKERKVRSYCG